jgi:hypothetical protein
VVLSSCCGPSEALNAARPLELEALVRCIEWKLYTKWKVSVDYAVALSNRVSLLPVRVDCLTDSNVASYVFLVPSEPSV